MDISLRHSVEYGTERSVPVSLVAHSLLANERLAIEAVRLLERISPSFEVEAISVRVAAVSNESPLKELLIVALVVLWQEDLAKEVPDLIQKLTGQNVPDSMDSLVSLLVVAIAIYSISGVIERLMPGKSAKRLIEEYEKKKARIAEITGVSAETIDSYCNERVTKGGKSLYEKALGFFEPAKLAPNVGILLPNGETISSEVIEEVPLRGEIDDFQETDTYEVDNVVIDIHRSDKDERKYGWRAVVPIISEKKVRMELHPDINQAILYGVRQIVGDVAVIEGADELGAVEIKRYHLLKVHSADGSKA